MWNEIKEKKSKPDVQTQQFMRSKIDSASWFIESIRQRQNTLMNVMKTIVALQEDFFKFGDGLKPMILKDVAERIGMDISTISRVVNGKYVQTNFGVYELKYFFNEGLTTESGEEVSNREVKNILQVIINEEDKRNPHSDQALAALLNDKGFNIARRTVSKYREQLNEPVARLRKQII
jgi:RNA polymerase sigma-54 factor